MQRLYNGAESPNRCVYCYKNIQNSERDARTKTVPYSLFLILTTILIQQPLITLNPTHV
ncbi:MAG: hypothetical protein RIC07_38805 [Coleofasciculus sp. E1-EBD-02]